MEGGTPNQPQPPQAQAPEVVSPQQPPDGQPLYGQPPNGQQPLYGQPPNGQQPLYGQPPNGQQPLHGQPPPFGQQPPYGHHPLYGQPPPPGQQQACLGQQQAHQGQLYPQHCPPPGVVLYRAANTLHGLPRCIGLFQKFIAQQPENLIVKEKMFTWKGDDFDVKTEDGRHIFTVKAATFQIGSKKKVTDAEGNHLYTIKTEHFHLHPTQTLVDPEGRKLLTVRKRFQFMGSKAEITFTTPQGKEEYLLLEGGMFAHKAEITEPTADLVVGRIERMFTAAEIFGGKQCYRLEIAPGADMAILVGICICFDEIYLDKEKSNVML